MNPILLITAVIVSWLIFTWLLRVLKTTLKTAFLIAVIVLGLQVAVGIGPDQVLKTIMDLPQIIQDLFNNQPEGARTVLLGLWVCDPSLRSPMTGRRPSHPAPP